MSVDLATAVDRFAREAFFYDGPPLDRHTRLIEAGVIDSTGVLELVGFLEQRFGVMIEDREISPEHLGSVARIEALVKRKQRGPVPEAATGGRRPARRAEPPGAG
jgi:acyl carrier protein